MGAWAEQRGTGWRAAWHDQGGRKRYKSGFTHKRAAEQYALKESDRAKGVVDPRMTWGQWRDRWLAARQVEPSTDKRDRQRIAAHLDPRWERVQLRRITRLDVQTWVNGLDVSAWTARRVFYMLSTSLKAAVDHGYLVANPCAGVKLPTPGPGHERFLTPAEFQRLDGVLTGRDAMVVELLAYTGMRWGEMAGLHVHRVDLERKVVDVVETWDPDGWQIKGYPKGKRRRAIPINAWLAEQIRAYLGEHPPARTCGREHAAGTRCRSGLLIVGDRGGPLNREHFDNDVLTPAVRAAELDHLRIHDLRHTCASWLIQAGVPLAEVSRILGHSSIAVTQRYTHLADTQWEAVRNALPVPEPVAPTLRIVPAAGG